MVEPHYPSRGADTDLTVGHDTAVSLRTVLLQSPLSRGLVLLVPATERVPAPCRRTTSRLPSLEQRADGARWRPVSAQELPTAYPGGAVVSVRQVAVRAQLCYLGHVQSKNQSPVREAEMHQTRKGDDWRFGMKLQNGVEVARGLAHSPSATAANHADVTEAHRFMRGDKRER